MWVRRYIIAFSVSIIFSAVLTPLARMLALRLNIVDHPDDRKNHRAPMPVLGGVAIYIALVAGVFFTFYYSHAAKVILFGGLICLLLGIIDDKKNVPATLKVMILLTLAVVLSRYGVLIHFFNAYTPDLFVTLFWILLVTSAINAIDNMDGLACGISAISAFLFVAAALMTKQYIFGVVSAALCGSALGFLPYNFKPAKIFMGNGGSFFLGFTLASISIMADWSDYPLISFMIPTLVLAVPIFDISFVVLWRFKKRITRTIKDAILYSARDHLSHRLVKLGLTERRAVIMLYLLSAGVGISAIIALPLDSIFEVTFLLLQALIILLALAVVINVGTEDLKKDNEDHFIAKSG